MRLSIQNFVKACPACQQDKSSNQKPFGLLQPLEIPDSRWHTVSMDFITSLPKSAAGHNAILVFVDKLSKMVILAPTSDTCTAEDAARLFITNVWQHHGTPSVLISDRDTRFIARFWKAFSATLQIQHRYSSAFHPQTDGQTERANRVIEEVLRHFLDGTHRNWEELLPMVAFSINNAKSQSTGASPFFLNFGRHPVSGFPIDFSASQPLPALHVIFQNMSDTLDRVKLLLRSAQDRQKSYADQFRQPHSFQVGDSVLLSTKHLSFKSGKKKLQPRWVGPFNILHLVGSAAVKLELPASYGRLHDVFHVSLVKPFISGGSFKPLPPLDQSSQEDGQFYAVERILAHRDRRSGRKKRREYLIKWEGFDDSHNSWEPEANLTPDLVCAYSSVS